MARSALRRMRVNDQGDLAGVVGGVDIGFRLCQPGIMAHCHYTSTAMVMPSLLRLRSRSPRNSGQCSMA